MNFASRMLAVNGIGKCFFSTCLSRSLQQPGFLHDQRDVLLRKDLFYENIHAILKRQAERSVVVESVDFDVESDGTDAYRALSAYGKIKYFNIQEQVEPKSRYLVEFESRESAERLLNQGADGAIASRLIDFQIDPAIRKKAHNTRSKRKKDGRKRNVVSSKMLKMLLNDQNTIEDQVKIATDHFAMSSDEIRSRYLFIQSLNDSLQRTLDMNFALKPFGSSFTGAGLTGSDMDVLILSDHLISAMQRSRRRHGMLEKTSYHDIYPPEECVSVLKNVRDVIRTQLNISDTELISEARVPVLKFQYPLLNLNVDIVANHLNGYNYLNVINWYIRYDERVGPLLVLVRKWAEARSLIDHGINYFGFTPFMFQISVLVYLARVGVIPSGFEIGSTHQDTFRIYKSPEKFRTRSSVNNSDSVSQLLLGYFQYFGTYGFTGRKLCLAHGNANARRSANSKFYMRSPFDESGNIAENCREEELKTLTLAMKKTARFLNLRYHKREKRDWGLSLVIFCNDGSDAKS